MTNKPIYDEGAVWERAKAAYMASHRKPEDTDFPCRSCGAEIGTPCSWKKWRRSNSGDVSHAPRWDKARRARNQYYLDAARAADAACDAARAEHAGAGEGAP
ncbi:hypothetical protein GCM10023334_029130 [Nonomuraea thailandensis]